MLALPVCLKASVWSGGSNLKVLFRAVTVTNSYEFSIKMSSRRRRSGDFTDSLTEYCRKLSEF